MNKEKVLVEVSARHVHVTKEHLEILTKLTNSLFSE